MEAADITVDDETCGAFRRLNFTSGAVHRFVVGEDRGPRQMSSEEMAQELGDPFSTFLLRQGIFPRTAEEAISAIGEQAPPGDPLKDEPSFFVLGEGSQHAIAPETTRFLVTRGAGADGPDVIVSAFSPRQRHGIELMAWDRAQGGFNYFQSAGVAGAWVFAGNSKQAFVEDTEFKGPFESHRSGNFLIKELKAPWIHWHSPDAEIRSSAFPDTDFRRSHEWFEDKVDDGAFILERDAARPSIIRWTSLHFDRLVSEAGTVERPKRLLLPILVTETANLITATPESGVGASEGVELPATFFADVDAFADLGLPTRPSFPVAGPIYQQALERFEVHLTDGDQFRRPGDTHFFFLVPERAFEDLEILRGSRRIGLISDRLAACLLMTDFPNPVFSTRRAALLERVLPMPARVGEGPAAFSEQLANAILAASEQSDADGPEREFAERWGAGEDWPRAFAELLNNYYDAVEARLLDQAALDAIFELAEFRRERFRNFPIGKEFPLLFARSNVEDRERRMLADGSVQIVD